MTVSARAVSKFSRSILSTIPSVSYGFGILDPRQDGQSRTRVRSAVETVLDDKLPETYDRAMFTEKCNSVYETMLGYASRGAKWMVAA